ncbi:hypothetical protein Ec53638_0021 [Escherichia coli 53638]|nr:hypothetical protein Ec53638_0021 [Escherichia coli 53638]
MPYQGICNQVSAFQLAGRLTGIVNPLIWLPDAGGFSRFSCS